MASFETQLRSIAIDRQLTELNGNLPPLKVRFQLGPNGAFLRFERRRELHHLFAGDRDTVILPERDRVVLLCEVGSFELVEKLWLVRR